MSICPLWIIVDDFALLGDLALHIVAFMVVANSHGEELVMLVILDCC